jgi:hypothetical protein
MLLLLPYPHLGASARCFENGELKRQTALSELVLHNVRHGASAVLKASECMWLGYTLHLLSYVNALKGECLARGYRISVVEPVPDNMKNYVYPPPWFGDERVHISHQALLLRRLPHFYAKYHWGILPTYPVLSPASFVYTRERSRRTCETSFAVYDSTGD